MFFLHIPFGTFGAGQVHREVLSNLLRHPDILVKLKSQLGLIFILLIHQLLVPTFPPFPLPVPLPFTELSTHVSEKQKASHSLMIYHPLPSIATHTWMVVVDRTMPKVVRQYCRNLEVRTPSDEMGGLGWNGGTLQVPQPCPIRLKMGGGHSKKKNSTCCNPYSFGFLRQRPDRGNTTRSCTAAQSCRFSRRTLSCIGSSSTDLTVEKWLEKWLG